MTDYIYQEKMHQNPSKKIAQMMQHTPIQHKPCTDDLRIKHHLPISPVFSGTDHLDTIQLCGKDSRARDKIERDKRATRRHQEKQASSGSGLKTTKKKGHINFTDEYTGIVAEVLRSADDLTTLMEEYDRERFEEKKYIVRYQKIWDQIYTELFAQTEGELLLSQMQNFCNRVQALIEEKRKALLFMLEDESENIQKVIGNGDELYEWLKEYPLLNIVLNKALLIKPKILDNIFKYLIKEKGGTFYASHFPEIIHIITALLKRVQASLGVITISDPNGDISRVIAEPIDLYYLLADFPPPSLLENKLFFAHPVFLKRILDQIVTETKGVIESPGLQNALNAVYKMIQEQQGQYNSDNGNTSFMDADKTRRKYGEAWTSTVDGSRVSFDIHPSHVRSVPDDIMTKYNALNENDFIGFHFTTHENAISLLKSAPHKERIGSSNNAGKGMGFYVTNSLKDSLWGPAAVRIYVKDLCSLPKIEATSERATEETTEILSFSKHEIVIPIMYFDRISVFLQEEWEICKREKEKKG